MPEFQRFSYDVLVIGAGGAGLRAAIEAAANGAKVGVVCKSLARQSPHRDGRGWHCRGPGQCRRSR